MLRRTPTGPLEERYVDQTYTRLTNSDGTPYGVFVHAFEVTERVLARARLQEGESQLKLATETARIGAWTFDFETNRYSLGQLFVRRPLVSLQLALRALASI